MSSGKAGGADGFLIDLIKDAGDFLLDKLAVLFSKCLQNCTVPSTWKNAIIIIIIIIIIIHKKGDIKDLENYRSIRFLSVAYKLVTKVLTNRISATLDSNLPIEQAGFRNRYSATDHIHVINQVRS